MKEYNEPRCKICSHTNRKEIDKLLLEGVRTGRDIARTYGVSENSLSIHKHKHIMTQDMAIKLKEIVKDAILKDKIQPNNATDWIKLVEFAKDMDNENRDLTCETCPKYKPKKDLGTALKEFLGEDNSPDRAIYLNPDVYTILKKIKGESESYNDVIKRLIDESGS